jgi:hypothetical protein
MDTKPPREITQYANNPRSEWVGQQIFGEPLEPGEHPHRNAARAAPRPGAARQTRC